MFHWLAHGITIAIATPAPSPTPLLVTVTNPRDFGTFVWAVIAGIAGTAAVVIAIWQLVLTRRAVSIATEELIETRTQSEIQSNQERVLSRQLSKKSALSLVVAAGKVAFSVSEDPVVDFRVPLTVSNSGDKGQRDFRVHIAFSPGILLGMRTNSNFKFDEGDDLVQGGVWRSLDAVVGPIYAHDSLWIGDVSVRAKPGNYEATWTIVCEDGRFPDGLLARVPVSLQTPANP